MKRSTRKLILSTAMMTLLALALLFTGIRGAATIEDAVQSQADVYPSRSTSALHVLFER